MAARPAFPTTTAGAVLRAAPRWASLLLATTLLAYLLQAVVVGYVAHGQMVSRAPEQPAQALVIPHTADRPPPTSLGPQWLAVPPDRVADNRAPADH